MIDRRLEARPIHDFVHASPARLRVGTDLDLDLTACCSDVVGVPLIRSSLRTYVGLRDETEGGR